MSILYIYLILHVLSVLVGIYFLYDTFRERIKWRTRGTKHGRWILITYVFSGLFILMIANSTVWVCTYISRITHL